MWCRGERCLAIGAVDLCGKSQRSPARRFSALGSPSEVEDGSQPQVVDQSEIVIRCVSMLAGAIQEAASEVAAILHGVSAVITKIVDTGGRNHAGMLAKFYTLRHGHFILAILPNNIAGQPRYG